MQRLVRAVSAFAAAVAVAFSPVAVRAGTTGTIVGRIVDQNTSAAVEGARVSVASPSQNATSVTDAAGGFRFLSLNPDTYTVTVERTGYETLSLAGVTVQADQTQTLNRAVAPRLARIGGTTARRATDLIRAGTTSDVYSVSGAYQDTSQALGGPGGLTNAYAAIQSVPGANVQQGQQGWFQTLSIRGGDIDQVGYELDGIPTNRVYDNAPQTMLSNLGQQELQVYTGGTPASSDASSISGYVNQVIRTGTYPGFKTAQFGIGSPQLFNKGQVEFGGTDARRRFSYYGGVAQATQAFRYIDQYNGASDPRFFYPLVIDSNRFNVYDAAPVDFSAVFPNAFGPGQTYGIAGTNDREAVLNLHYAIPHGDLRDDVQALYVSSDIFTHYYGSLNDQGGPFSPGVQQATGSYPSAAQATWHDGYVYNGPIYGAPNAAFVQPYYFMSSPTGRPLGGPLSNSAQDSNDNGVGIVKFQYQHAFDPKSYLQLCGYTMYSNWFITGLSNQNFTGFFGGELDDCCPRTRTASTCSTPTSSPTSTCSRSRVPSRPRSWCAVTAMGSPATPRAWLRRHWSMRADGASRDPGGRQLLLRREPRQPRGRRREPDPVSRGRRRARGGRAMARRRDRQQRPLQHGVPNVHGDLAERPMAAQRQADVQRRRPRRAL